MLTGFLGDRILIYTSYLTKYQCIGLLEINWRMIQDLVIVTLLIAIVTSPIAIVTLPIASTTVTLSF